MMNKQLKEALRWGFILGLIIIFFVLIGFMVTGSSLLENTFKLGPSKLPGSLPETSSLVLLLGLLGLWGGSAATRPVVDQNLLKVVLMSLVAGVTTGVMVGLFGYGLGNLIADGTDPRIYLSGLSPDSIRFFLFNQTPAQGAAQLFGWIVLSDLAGGLLAFVLHRCQPLFKRVGQTTSNVNQSELVSKVRSNPFIRYGLLIVILAVLIIVPRVWGSYWNYIMGTVGIYILLGLGLNIIVGLSGQLVLGYVAFFAVGAYSFALLTAPEPHNLVLNFWVALVIAILMSALTGVLIGLPIMRLRGDYLAIVTLGFGEMVRILIKSDVLTPLTAGPRGIRNIAGPTLFGKTLVTDVDFMYVIIVAVLIGIFIAYRIQNSRVGRVWLSISADETVAQATGVDTQKYKLLALALGAAMAGFGGALFASRNQFTGPEDHIFMVSINVLCLVIVGGMGSIPGVVLGAFALKGIPEILRDLESYRMLVFGALLVVMMIMRPEGLWPIRRPKLEVKSESDADPGDEIPILAKGGD
ncbi:MAG: leucine/isoleucine/valine transporter permease subunit [Anaerolineaceae bacterium]